MTLDDPLERRIEYSEEYKRDVFYLWFNNKQPAIARLYEMIPEEWGKKPTLSTLRVWGSNDFVPKANRMNREMSEQLEKQAIQEKFEMLKRHGVIGREMQNMALDALRKIGDEGDLGEHAAVRMLVAGVEMERDSVGVPQAIEKLLNQSDEDLLEEVQKLIGESEAEILED